MAASTGIFSSKDDLIARTLDHVFQLDSSVPFDMQEYVGSYLSVLHRDNSGKGCPTAGMVAETRHQSDIARKVMSDGTRAQIDRLSSSFSGDDTERRRQAIVSWAGMVSAIMIARGIEDPQLSEELLSETRTWIEGAIREDGKAGE